MTNNVKKILFLNIVWIVLCCNLTMSFAQKINPQCNLDDFLTRASRFEKLNDLASARGELITAAYNDFGKRSIKVQVELARIVWKQGDYQTAGQALDRYQQLRLEGMEADLDENQARFIERFYTQSGVLVLEAYTPDFVEIPAKLVSDVARNSDAAVLAQKMLKKENNKLLRRANSKIYLPSTSYQLGNKEVDIEPGKEVRIKLQDVGEVAQLVAAGKRLALSRQPNPASQPYGEILPLVHKLCVEKKVLAAWKGDEGKKDKPGWLRRNALWLIPVSTAVGVAVVGATILALDSDSESQQRYRLRLGGD